MVSLSGETNAQKPTLIGKLIAIQQKKESDVTRDNFCSSRIQI